MKRRRSSASRIRKRKPEILWKTAAVYGGNDMITKKSTNVKWRPTRDLTHRVMTKFAKKSARALIAKSMRPGRKRAGHKNQGNPAVSMAFQTQLSAAIDNASDIQSWRNRRTEFAQLIQSGEQRLKNMRRTSQELRAAVEKASNSLDTRAHIKHLRQVIPRGEELGLNNRAGPLLQARSLLVALQTTESLKKSLHDAVAHARRTRYKGFTRLQETLAMYMDAIVDDDSDNEMAYLPILQEAKDLIVELEKERVLRKAAKKCRKVVASVEVTDEAEASAHKLSLESALAAVREKISGLPLSLDSVVDAQVALAEAVSLVTIIDTVVHVRACVRLASKSFADGDRDPTHPAVQKHMQALSQELKAAVKVGVPSDAQVLRDARDLLAEWHDAGLRRRVTSAHNRARVSRNPNPLTREVGRALDDGAGRDWPEVKLAQELVATLGKEKVLERVLQRTVSATQTQVLAIHVTTATPTFKSLMADLDTSITDSVRAELREASPVLDYARQELAKMTSTLDQAVAHAKQQLIAAIARARQSRNPDPLSAHLRELVGTHALLPQSGAEATAARDLVADLTATIARRASAVTELTAALSLTQPKLTLGKQAFVDAVGEEYPQLLHALEEAEGAAVAEDCVQLVEVKAKLDAWKKEFCGVATECVTRAAIAGELHAIQRVFRVGRFLGCAVVQEASVKGSKGDSIAMLMAFSGDMDILQVLIDEGADMSATNARGETIADICRRFHQLELSDVQMLSTRWLSILGEENANDQSLEEFKTIDTDNSGYIDKFELRESLRLIGIKVKYGEHFDRLLDFEFNERFDQDANGQIDFKEFKRCYQRYLRLLQWVKEGGADVLALQEAVKGNDIRGMLDLIVRRQTPVDSDLGDGYTALTLCCCDGDAEAVSELLGLKANPQARERESGCTSLMMAAFNNHSDTIRVLLEHEQQARRVDTAEAVPSELQTQSMPSGETALYLACQEGHVDAVRALLEPKLGFNEASLKQSTTSGVFPLYVAANNGHAEVVQALCEAPAIDVNTRKDVGQSTALFIASQFSRHAVVEVLLAAKADASLGTATGTTPLMIAVWHGETRLCELLLGSPSVTENLHKHAMLAAFLGDIDILSALTDSGQVLTPDMQDDDGATLHDILSKFHGLSFERAKVLGRRWREKGQQFFANTKEQEAEMEKKFAELDLNHDSKLNREELADCFRKLGLQETYGQSFQKFVDVQLQRFDRDKDGTVDMEEFRMSYRRFATIHLHIGIDTAQQKAATNIQRATRGAQARGKLLQQQAAATRVQQTVRGHHDRRSVAAQHDAAVRIQCCYKGEVARARVRTMLANKKLEQDAQTRAATVIQNAVRHRNVDRDDSDT